MSTAEILDRTFSLYRNNFLLFAGIAILPALIALILHVIGITAQLTLRTPARTLAQTQLMQFAYGLLVFFIASVIGGGIATGATVNAVYDFYLGKKASIGGCYKNVLATWFRVIIAAVLVFLLLFLISLLVVVCLSIALFWPLAKAGGEPAPWIAGSFVLLIVAVVFFCWMYLSAWLAFVIPALLLDKNGIFRAFRRSHRLSKGSRGRILLVLVLALVLTLGFTWTLRIPAYMIFNQYRQQVPFQLWISVAQFLSAVLAGPVATIATALFYIDQRIRKEAFDLHVMMQSIQGSNPAAAPAP